MPWVVFSTARSFCSPEDGLLRAQHRGMDVSHEKGRREHLAADTEQMCSTESTAPDQTHAIPWSNTESNNRVIISGS